MFIPLLFQYAKEASTTLHGCATECIVNALFRVENTDKHMALAHALHRYRPRPLLRPRPLYFRVVVIGVWYRSELGESKTVNLSRDKERVKREPV